ncbi:MAG TPA: response regulator [Gemmatimonadales bacterium]|nr:response regulator [Gemmatimonadales bacterium]
MRAQTPFIRQPLALLASSGVWINRALESTLQPLGYRAVSVSTGTELLERAPALAPDVILLDANLQDTNSVTVCRALRRNAILPWNVPIIMLTSNTDTKQQRLAALEAGATDYLNMTLNAEELAFKLDAMTRVKLETDRRLEDSGVNPSSGLYTVRGLERRARELTNDAFRRHAPLACLALGIEVETSGATRSAARVPAAAEYAAQVLLAGARASDAMGGLGVAEFALLAPATAPPGAEKMARRLSQVVESAGPRPAGVPPLRVRAGYEAIADVHETPINPATLLEHASAALHQAASTGNGERIRAYQP